MKASSPYRKTGPEGQLPESGVEEATGDPKFDKMLKGITGKRQVAKQQKADTKQQARDAFGGMFGGGNPANKLSIRKKGVAEGKGLAKKVKIVKGSDAGKTGWIREIKHGAYKGAPKTYYIDLDDGGQANNLPATALRLVKEQGVAEGSDDGYGYKSLSTEQIMKLIQSGNWEAVQDVVPDKHIQLRNNRNGKSTTIHVKRDVDEGEYKDTVDKSKIPAVQRKAQGGDWKVSTKDLEHERSKSPTGPEGLAKAKQRLGMNENQQLPPEVIELLKKVAQSDAAPEHKKAIINAIMAKYQPIKDIAEEPKQTAREKFNKGLKRAGFDPDAAAKRLTDLIAKQKAEREKFEKENPAVYGDTPDVKEEKVRLDPKCWKGKKIGNPKTKMKGGVRVNNCVPK